MDAPLVTIGIPIYNTGKYVAETLDSIKNQTYKNIELIVVNDGSTDDSAEQVEWWSKQNSYPIKFINNGKNIGLTKTCNIILDNANGKYLQKVDADDILLENKIERHVNILESSGEQVAAVFSYVELIDENGAFLYQDYNERIGRSKESSGDFYYDLLELNFIPNPSVVSRTKILREVGGYDSTLLYEDWDMWLRLAKSYKIYYDPEVTCYYRIHKESMMADPQKLVLRNSTNYATYIKNLGINKRYDHKILKRLRLLSIYSYFRNDPAAREKLKFYLSKKFDVKVFIYYVLALAGVKHYSSNKN
jgi:glycosyltransferase involved in cell wall biosynthesis